MTQRKEIPGAIASGEAALRLFAEMRFQSVKSGELQLPPEREFIAELLKLANFDDNQTQDRQISRLYCWFVHGAAGQRPKSPVGPAVGPSAEELLVRAFGIPSMKRELNEARNLIRPCVEQVHTNVRTARLTHAAKISEWLEKTEFHGVPVFERNTVVYKYALVAPTRTSAEHGRQNLLRDVILPRAAWALALLLDKNRKFDRQLRQCDLDSCHNFFLSASHIGGGRPSNYCSKTHADVARLTKAANRSRRYRENMAARHK